MRRKIIFNEKEAKEAKANVDADDGRPPWFRRRKRKAWPVAVPLLGIERRMPVRDGDEGQKEVVWDTNWVDAKAIRTPTPKQRLSTMTDPTANTTGPFYMLTAIGTSLTVIGLCLILGSIHRLQRILWPLVMTGQMALSLYVGHALVGFTILKWIDMRRGESLSFIAFFVVMCWVTSVAFSAAWRSFFKRGPLEHVMRWMTD